MKGEVQVPWALDRLNHVSGRVFLFMAGGPAGKKRGVANITDYVELRNLVDLAVKAKPIPYLDKRKQIRDRALLAFIAATGMRISEALSVKRGDFNQHNPDFVVVNNVRILKRRKETIMKDFVLPRTGVLKPLTDLVMLHYRNVKDGAPLFDISRQRAWQVIVYMTGKWCHYFRSQRISFLVNKIRSTTAVADLLGIKKSSTIDHYYKGGWGQFRKELAPKE